MNRNNSCRHCYLSLTLTALLCWLSSAALALPDDKNQPIQLKADSAEMDDRKGISVYIGQVHVKQGSLEIEADKVTIYSDDQGVKQIVAIGRPVKFRQQPKIDEPLTEGFALTLEYYADIDRAVFIDQAKLIQGGDTFTGDRIQFELEQDIVTASSKGKQAGSQVEMFLPPRKKQ